MIEEERKAKDKVMTRVEERRKSKGEERDERIGVDRGGEEGEGNESQGRVDIYGHMPERSRRGRN